MNDLDELWCGLDRIATTPRLLVACDFDGALAPDLGDPGDARAEQLSSEALNVQTFGPVRHGWTRFGVVAARLTSQSNPAASDV